MVRSLQLLAGLLLLVALEVLRVYFIMPFPGSQRSETIDVAYFLHHNIFYFRIIGLLIILFPAIHFLWLGTTLSKWLTGIGLVIYLYLFFLFNYKFMADKMFYQPKHKTFSGANASKISKDDLILGVSLNDEAKAYPLEVIGYHHQVRDTVGNEPLMITYCTVCRTGRAYSPVIDGKGEEFRLVGMDHFNAMFEDRSTKSWWRQVSGEAIAGPLKGRNLKEVPSQQMTLQAWLEIHPDTKIMQPDSTYKHQYEELKDFDKGNTESKLLKKDSLSWNDKSWIVGIQLGMHARAYDWNDLLRQKIINDTLAGVGILVAVEPDSASFHVWNRDSLQFIYDGQSLKDIQTRSSWNWQGKAVEGSLKDHRMPVIQSYQEFWHSWNTFRPQTTRYVGKNK